MTARISASDRFSTARIEFTSYNNHGFLELYFITDADPPITILFRPFGSGTLPSTASSNQYEVDIADDLAVLREIWESDDGFRDADGNSVTVELRNCPFTNDLDELEAHGFLNPLSADSWDRWVDFLKIRGRFQEGATINNEGDIHLHFNLEPEAFAPDDGVTTYNLGDYWRTYEWTETNTDLFYLTMELSESDGYTDDTIGEHYPIRALLKALNDNRHSSASAVDLEPSTRTEMNTGLVGRLFDIDFGSGHGTFQFRLNTLTTIKKDTTVIRVRILFLEQNSNTEEYDEDTMTEWLEDQNIEVDTGTDAVATSKFGVFRGVQWIIDSVRRLIPMNDRLIHRGRDAQGSYEIPLEAGTFREVDYEDLDDDPDHSGQKIMPAGAHTRVVHFRGDSDAIIRIQDPTEGIYSPGSGIDKEIHNVSPTSGAELEVRDWENNNIGTLRGTQGSNKYREHFPYRMIRYKNNEGRMERGIAPFKRRYHRDESQFTPPDLGDANYLQTSTTYLRLIPHGSGNPDFTNAEAFSETTTQPTNGTNYSVSNVNHYKYSKRIDRPGRLSIGAHIELKVLSTASGSLTGAWLFMVLSLDDGNVNIAFRNVGTLTAGDDLTWNAYGEAEVREAGTDAVQLWVEYDQSSTMDVGDIDVAAYRLTIDLEQDIDKEFTPS